ncbi:unnamed protein product [Schistosoma mattheei]|uniref:Uncharacterized protein n=1 Tax=Schistosoma mattheei TaxID=31246 RepID=A0AA85BB16_9TREM|nr:unnamed protein product [Schistosoma mattheei]
MADLDDDLDTEESENSGTQAFYTVKISKPMKMMMTDINDALDRRDLAHLIATKIFLSMALCRFAWYKLPFFAVIHALFWLPTTYLIAISNDHISPVVSYVRAIYRALIEDK